MLRGSSLKYSIINGRRKWNDVRYSWGEPPEKRVKYIMISWVMNTAFGAPRRGAIDDDAAALKWIIFHQLCIFLLRDCSCGKTCADVSPPPPRHVRRSVWWICCMICSAWRSAWRCRTATRNCLPAFCSVRKELHKAVLCYTHAHIRTR